MQERIRDEPDNHNNRFEVAAELNRAISGRLTPFWGCPRSAERPCLGAKKTTQGNEGARLPERRITEQLHRSSHPVWKLFTAGSVGSQVLLGIPRVANLRCDPDLAAISRVWPFETGLRRLPPRALRDWSILHAEIYPSLGTPKAADGEVKDAAQVRAIADSWHDGTKARSFRLGLRGRCRCQGKSGNAFNLKRVGFYGIRSAP